MPRALTNVRGKTVLITGAGYGIGKELALQYGQLGAKVICWDSNEMRSLQTLCEIKTNKGEAYAYVCDVADRKQVFALAEKVKRDYGIVKILINNTGLMPVNSLIEDSEEEINNLIAIIQAFVPDMLAKGEGHVVSILPCAGLFDLVPFGCNKFAVREIMQALDEELRHLKPKNNVKLTTIYHYMVPKSTIREPHFLFDSKQAATRIIRAQRSGIEEVSFPRSFFYLEKLGRLLPKKAQHSINDFITARFNSEKVTIIGRGESTYHQGGGQVGVSDVMFILRSTIKKMATIKKLSMIPKF